MTNETREALVLLKERLTACEAAEQHFAALKTALQQDASGSGVAAATAAAERSLSALRAAEKTQRAFLARAGYGTLAAVIAAEPNLKERLAVHRAARAAAARQDALRDAVQTCRRLLEQSITFINYQLNVISGTAAEDTYGSSQPIAGPDTGVRREIAMFDADV